MARQAVAAREYEEADDAMSPAMLARRVGWIALAAAWIFLVVALVSFDSADWPSHTVSAHNDPTRNLCGPAGALVAYWCYHVIGIGSWVLLAGLAGYLGVIVTGRSASDMFGGEVLGSETFIKSVQKADKDSSVKAIVLRIDSPGGSALASDLMWRALQKVKKPIVVSMG
ncbi:MAG: DNA translocase FtsK 4TM domain-containing protein, partial [Chloroflexi bacterium]|nr:DNA translocase FtsK 4TM domain-containing protein [Chloroflexota bacterium]